MIKDYSSFLNESIQYESIIDETLSQTIKICEKYLSDLDLGIFFDDEYDYDDRDWVAVYEAGSVIEGDITISINKPLFIKTCMENDFNEKEIKNQVRISIWHEVGHGLMEYLFEQWNNYVQSGDENESMDAWHDNYEFNIDNDDNEEELVEEFGEYMAELSYITPELYNMIEDFKKIEW